MRYLAALTLVGCSVSLSTPAHAWQVYRIHPFIECTADELPGRLTDISGNFPMVGLQNDWIHRAIAIAVTDEESVTVKLSLAGDPEACKHIRLRPVGFVKQKDLGYVMDPIFDRPRDISLDQKAYVRNLANIYDFPTVTLTRQDPVVVWVTADTRGMAPGRYYATIVMEGPEQSVREEHISLLVRPYALPLENPLITGGWQWMGKQDPKLARVYHEYGINLTHIDEDMEVARKEGFRFFLFVFGPSWYGKAPAEVPEAEVEARIAAVKAMVARLKLKPGEWALYPIDEPNDKSVPNQVAWAKLIRSKWPEARFMYNPGWGPGPRNEWGSVDGTVKPLLDYATVWLPYSAWLWDDVSAQSIPLMKQHAEQVWFYEIAGFTANRQRSVGRGPLRTLGWMAWRYGLQGASFYSANAYTVNAWSDCSAAEEYGCFYNEIPARSAEALREGIQEYKRLAELKRLGVAQARLDEFADRALRARSVQALERVRWEMDELLLKTVAGKGR
jgi:hypothetical protein